MQGPRASGVKVGGFRCWVSAERTLICSAAESVCCRSACFYGAHEHMHGGTRTLSYTSTYTNKLKTYFTHFTLMELKRATGDVGLIFSEEKQIVFEKSKGKRCRLMFMNDNNSNGQLTCNTCVNI